MKDADLPYSLRLATLVDMSELEILIQKSARGLARQNYSEEQIEAALGTA
jgi:hypothetical protein